MKVFISWSGNRSKQLARALFNWIPNVIQSVKPWMSEEATKGSRWGPEIARELQETRFGIVCVTSENLMSPWLIFETGALSKTLDSTFVCPYLLDLRPADLEGPLAQFQATRANMEDSRRLVASINTALGEGPMLTEIKLQQAFELWWPKLESVLNEIGPFEGQPPKRRTTDMILEELVELVRGVDGKIQMTQSLITSKHIEQAKPQRPGTQSSRDARIIRADLDNIDQLEMLNDLLQRLRKKVKKTPQNR
jgi:TIR domain